MTRALPAVLALALGLSAAPALAMEEVKPNELMLTGGYLMTVGGGLSYRRQVSDLLSVRLLADSGWGVSSIAADGGAYTRYGLGLGLLTNGWLYGGASANFNHVPGAPVGDQLSVRGSNVALNLIGGVRGALGPVALALELRIPAYHTGVGAGATLNSGGNTEILNLMAGHRW